MTNVGLVSLGCSKNLVDSEIMLGILADNGYNIVQDAVDAEIIIVNTCAFIDDAKQESIDTILSLAQYKSENCKLLICTGCLAERYAEEIKKELPEVDAIVGVGDFEKIADVIKMAEQKNTPVLVGNKDAEITEGLPRIIATPGYTAYLKIAEGCDNKCTYCAIPSIRGRFRSRPIEALLDEARSLADSGVKELIVIAQDTGKYGVDLYGEYKLAYLLLELCKIEKLSWVRVHYTYPETITDELIDVFNTCDKLVPYLDIPIQHANNEILKKMNRHTTKDELVLLIKRLRENIPGVCIRTSLIAGFPGETDKAFSELCEFVESAEFDRLGVFAYSQEEGTAAAKLPDQLPEEIKKLRAEEIEAIQREVSRKLNEKMVGKTLDVLVEGFSDYLYYGRTYKDSVDVDPKVYFGAPREISPGEIVKVKILDFEEYDLMGEMINE